MPDSLAPRRAPLLRLARAARALAIAAAVAALPACDPDYTLHFPPSDRLRPESAHPPPQVRILLTSDFGHGPSIQRWRVVEQMKRREARSPFDAVLVTGDNDYACGPDVRLPGADACTFAPGDVAVAPGARPPADPSFVKSIEAPLAELATAGRPPPPVYLALGNHDVLPDEKCAVPGFDKMRAARLKACLEVAHESPTWHMPGRHYVLDAGPVRVIVLDGNLIKGDYGGFKFDDEEAFVRRAAQGCGERICFLAEHFPPATGGVAKRREPPSFLSRVARVEAAAGPAIRGWLTGHHHDLQHLTTPSGLDVFVFGNSSAGRNAHYEETSPEGARQSFFSTRFGFAVLEAAGDRWWLRFEGVDGKPLHCCEAAGAGRCEPVTCGPIGEGPTAGATVAARTL